MLTILDLLRDAGLEPRRAGSKHGGEYHSPCPFCGGRDRFRSWPGQNKGEKGGRYSCRQCGAYGDAIQFLIDYRGLRFKEACSALGVTIESVPNRTAVKRPREVAFEPTAWEPPCEGWRRKAEAFVQWAERELWTRHEREVDWLENVRGIGHDAIKAFRLGWCPEDMYRPRESWGLCTLFNAKGNPQKIWLPAGLIIPFFQDGVLHRVKVRRPHPDKGPAWAADKRYWQIAGSGNATWHINPERKAHAIIETEVDGILVAQEAGDLVGVLPLGSASNRPDVHAMPRLVRAMTILDALDYDEAGARHRAWWETHFSRNHKRWPVPDGKDPGEAFGLGYDIREWISLGLPPAITCRPERIDFPEIPDRAPEELPFYPWQSAVELRDLAGEYGLGLAKTATGVVEVVFPADANGELRQYVGLLLEEARKLFSWMEKRREVAR